MADLRDFTGKNRKFTGTIGERISTGTTAERDAATFGAGTIRFNTTTNLMEYYTGTEWKSIDAPPTITNFNVNAGSNVTSTFIPRDSSVSTIAINGSLFDTTGATVLFVGSAGTDVSPLTTTRNSGNLITVTVDNNSFNGANEPYDLKVTNGSGLFAILENCIVSDTLPVFTTAAGSLGTITDGTRATYTLSSAAATDPDGDTITYSITAGSLPAGLSLNSSTAAITGTASAVGTNTTSTFTVSAATTNQTATRQFSITVNAPVVTTFNSPGTFTVPVGLTSVDVLVVAGGGGGGGFGGGGAGGLIFRPGFTVTPGSPISVTVGQGGSGSTNNPGPPSVNGQNSVFSTLTAVGGGGGGQSPVSESFSPNENTGDGAPGGSGGGGGHPNATGTGGPGGTSGTGTQPTQPGDSGTYGFGNPGGLGKNDVPSNDGSPQSTAGGGGGAGGAGGTGNAQGSAGEHGGAGGIGKAYSISGTEVYYAGGGGGAYGGNPGLGGGGPAENTTGQNAATANRGGGGGTRASGGPSTSGPGGSGIVIVRY